MSSAAPNHMKTMYYTNIFNLVVPMRTLPLTFNMAAGGHLGFSKMLFFSHAFFSFILVTSYTCITRCFIVKILNYSTISINVPFLLNPIWRPAAILKIEIFDGSEGKSFSFALRNICAKGNICTII